MNISHVRLRFTILEWGISWYSFHGHNFLMRMSCFVNVAETPEHFEDNNVSNTM